MKLGLVYMFFDGEEVLYQSIKNLRPAVDKIVLVFQQLSHFKNFASDEAFKVVKKLTEEKLVDKVIISNGIDLPPEEHDVYKRNLGYEYLKSVGCTHYLLLDADEFYKIEEFERAKEFLDLNNYDASVCGIYSYIYEPTFRIATKDTGFVPFICKILPERSLKLNSPFYAGVYVDSARIPSDVRQCYLFKDKEIMMHHMTYVRRNFKQKILNHLFLGPDMLTSESDMGNTTREMINQLDEVKFTFKPKISTYGIAGKKRNVKLTQVPDFFNIGKIHKED
jgi:hypothetical protein